MKPLSICVGCGEKDGFEQESPHPHDVICTKCGLRYDCHTLEAMPNDDN